MIGKEHIVGFYMDHSCVYQILFLEGLGTTVESLITHLTQLKQMGAFDKITGLLLGTLLILKRLMINIIFIA